MEWDSDDDQDFKQGSKKFKPKVRACMSFFGGGCGKVFKKDHK